VKTGALYNYGRNRLGSITALTNTNQTLKTQGTTEPLKELNH
jgi:hypothetical protein